MSGRLRGFAKGMWVGAGEGARRIGFLGRSICVAAECECVSRSIPDGKGEWLRLLQGRLGLGR